MDKQNVRKSIECAETSLGIELDSTRIKAVLINNDFKVIGSGESE
ncbi:hypothetical protein [Ruoffia tabacinasalis]|nr:hypothetical protein [Ruoffia tabacinasalis]